MKWIAIILSVWFLGIAAVPCSDTVDFCYDNQPETVSAATHHHLLDFDEFCSPLCVCSCCGATVTLKLISPDSEILELGPIDGEISSFSPLYLSAYYGNIWQPPKIA